MNARSGPDLRSWRSFPRYFVGVGEAGVDEGVGVLDEGEGGAVTFGIAALNGTPAFSRQEER